MRDTKIDYEGIKDCKIKKEEINEMMRKERRLEGKEIREREYNS